MDTLTKQAIKQIRDKNYGERFLNESRPRLIIGYRICRKRNGL
ncbi:hypothetical protein BGP_6324 [Beggiatoa sp. PS]|nr:hypothetical protein BGP_6324 [Beggiatoa sp. PS]